MKRLPINRPLKRTAQLAIPLSLAAYAVFLVGLLSMGWDSWGQWLVLGAYLAQSQVLRLMLRFNRAAAAETFNGRLTIEASGLTMERPGFTCRVLPTAVVDVTATDRYFFVCFGMGRAWVVPRRCFRSGEDLAAAGSIFREIWEQCVPLPESTA